ncbi:MAG TPA: 5-histidylcysteine sulfoxide synthase [Pseudomonadales bacterium]|nr:5-histidylcysteine sulfoxide synthase [Pseudomonadales bacterium]
MTVPRLRTLLLTGDDVDAKREEISRYFNATYDAYESLFETLAGDAAWTVKPIPLRHPLIFYYGHTATFFVNKLVLAGMIEQRVNPQFESMFAVGVDEMSWDDLNDDHYDWPSPAEVKAYRDDVRAIINRLIETASLTLPIDWAHPWWAIVMGIEHELIHLETSSVLIRQQAIDMVASHPDWQPCTASGEAPTNDLIKVGRGSVALGKSDDIQYGWDNEYGKHEAEVDAFKAGKYLVSNREFLEFVEAGGYLADDYWLEEGREWRNFTQATHPTFWVRDGERWKLRLMTEVVEMPWNWPVEVNYHEAKAFCLWKSSETDKRYRLPTEDEWYRLFDESGACEPAPGEPSQSNLHLDHFASSCPVDRFQQGQFFDVTGNVWQWTETPIYPFDGFKVHPYYDDFSTPTFDDRHNLIKGGSWISCGNESLKASRYAFRRHFFQHAGFRYVVGGEPVKPHQSSYETDRMLSEYAEFHYGDEYFGVPNFSKALADMAIAACVDSNGAEAMRGRALDLGCAVGRATFELARHFEMVTGIDFSARFINFGVQLAEHGVIRYTITDEGELVLYRERRLEEMGLESVCDRVEFFQGDACNLKSTLTGYDLVLAANLIDRLYDPMLFVGTIHERINPGGILLIASPCTWLEEHTPREKWLGGFKKDGESFTTFEGLKQALSPNFTLLREPTQVPFVIRETRRKHQHTLSEVTLWRRN